MKHPMSYANILRLCCGIGDAREHIFFFTNINTGHEMMLINKSQR